MIHDVVIVGSGPAGYTAAIYAARAQLNPVILAGSVTAGGALMNTTEVENYPGFVEGIMGPELMTQMQEQAERFGADVRYEDVTALELEGDVKRITTSDDVYEARTVIISTGSEYRHLGIDGEERLSGHGVSYCATCDGFFFKDQDIVVVGGGDSAMEEATFLTRFARSVTVVHRRDELRASAVMAKRAQEDPKISFAWNSRVVELDGEDSLTGVTLEDTVTGERRPPRRGLRPPSPTPRPAPSTATGWSPRPCPSTSDSSPTGTRRLRPPSAAGPSRTCAVGSCSTSPWRWVCSPPTVAPWRPPAR